MNKKELDILYLLKQSPYRNQREIAESLGYSLGSVNTFLKNLIEEELLSQDGLITEKAEALIRQNSPKRAIILAAGSGIRMNLTKINVPKGLIELNGEKLIERLIRQLNEVGIQEIYIVVGYLKEKFEYLIDKYNVKLIVNTQYAEKNNLYSLSLASEHLENCYITPSDIYCKYNPFSINELYSWYMVSEEKSIKSNFRVNSKSEIVSAKLDKPGNIDIGICYLTKNSAAKVKNNLYKLCSNWHFDNSFWEETLYENEKMMVFAKVAKKDNIIEVNTFEQLKDINDGLDHLEQYAVSVINKELGTRLKDIKNIKLLKKGMTNRTFYLESENKKLVFQIPDKGTEALISRKNEATNYSLINNWDYTENVIYINPDTGCKLSRYFDNSRCCDPYKVDDVKRCMNILHRVHDSGIKVNHHFDIYEQIEYYEKLWNGSPSLFVDYEKTKQNVFLLNSYVEKNKAKSTFCHVDSVANNFMFAKNNQGQEEVHLIDWEYAAMNDPHMDIAMFGIKALYDRKQMDELINIYFGGNCEKATRIKIYCYISACGLFWSNWCEYKRTMGTEFGEYSLKQYRYAKEYYGIAHRYMNDGEKK